MPGRSSLHGGRVVQATCGHCRKVTEYSGPRPSYCGFCGKPLPPDQDRQREQTLTSPWTPTATPAALDSQATRSSSWAAPATDAQAPGKVGPYRLLRELGQGGMGMVL